MTGKTRPTSSGKPPSVEADRADTARRILHGLRMQPRLIPAWLTFNALYAKTNSERRDLMDFIRTHISDDQATIILNDLVDEMNYYAFLPPGNMRVGPGHSSFRERSTFDLRIANDGTEPPSLRLAHLLAAVYQVRCNLFHGRKELDDPRSQRLAEAGYRIVDLVLRVVL
jgi:hypothetical protein